MNAVKDLTRWGLTLFLLLSISTQHALASQENNSQKWIIKLRGSQTSASNNQNGYAVMNVKNFKANSRKKAQRLITKTLRLKKNKVLENMGFVISQDLGEAELKALATNPDVAYVEKNIIWQTQSEDAGSDTELPSHNYQNPWIQDVLGFSSDHADPYVNSDQTNNVIVAVVDSGARIDHPYLRSALQGNPAEINGQPGVDDDNNGFIDDTYGANAITRNGSANETFSSHGTHVSGIVKIVRDHAINTHSEARKVSILPVRFIGDSGQGSTAAAIQAMEYAAARGAKVINASWGAKGFDNYSQALYETFARLYAMDIVFTVAAGNADFAGPNNNDITPSFPANYNIPSLISVASVSPYYDYKFNGSFGLESTPLSAFSNYGVQSVHVAAPGDYISTNGGNGSGILSAYSAFGPWGNNYIRKQGTSMAAPVIAGIAGVIRAINPNLSAFEVKELILSTSRSVPSLNGYLKHAKVVHAIDAFQTARSQRGGSSNPNLPQNPVIAGGEDSEENSGGGGCASVSHLGGGGGGPFSGNSLGLLGMLYALSVLIKARRKKNMSR